MSDKTGKERFVLDTNVFGDVIEEDIDMELFEESDAQFLVTHIQEDELKDAGDDALRKKLMEVFEQVADEKTATESFALGISRLGEAKISSKGVGEEIRDELGKDSPNNAKDALIAETAIKNDVTLVTADKNLHGVVENLHPGTSVMKEDFLEWLEDE